MVPTTSQLMGFMTTWWDLDSGWNVFLDVSNVTILYTDEPSKPNNVEVVDWDKDHADLKWIKPDSDGGAPITGYIIEFKVSNM